MGQVYEPIAGSFVSKNKVDAMFQSLKKAPGTIVFSLTLRSVAPPTPTPTSTLKKKNGRNVPEGIKFRM